MREKFGSRSIDARAKQSALDYTPSGRRAYLQQQADERNITPAEVAAPNINRNLAVQQQKGEMRESLGPQTFTEDPPSISMPPAQEQKPGYFTGGLATPEDIGTLKGMGAIGTVKTPYGTVTLPQTIPAQEFSEFLPTTSGPLSMFELPKPKPYMGGVLTAASRWSRQI